MTTKEFRDSVYDLGFNTDTFTDYIFIDDVNFKSVASISLILEGVADTTYVNFVTLDKATRQALYSLISEYASTDIFEREE